MRRAAALIAQAKRPIFYGGGGLVNAGPEACAAFTELVRHTGAPCTLTLMGLGAFPASSPQFVGMLGMHGTVEANLAMHNADLVVCIGARFDDRITGKLSEFCPHARKIHIDIDPASINKVVRVDVALVGDCLPLVQALRAELGDAPLDPARLAPGGTASLPGAPGLPGLHALGRVHPAAAPDGAPERRAGRPRRRRLHRRGPAPDVGRAVPALRPAQSLADLGRRRHHGLRRAAAIGAQIAHPDKTVVCVSGDASVLMNIQELSTAMQHQTPVKVVLCNNGYMGMVRQWQELIHGGRYSHSYNASLPDFVARARFGWGAARVDDPAQLDAALAECLAHDGPYFLDVAVAAQENCFPMMPPATATSA